MLAVREAAASFGDKSTKAAEYPGTEYTHHRRSCTSLEHWFLGGPRSSGVVYIQLS